MIIIGVDISKKKFHSCKFDGKKFGKVTETNNSKTSIKSFLKKNKEADRIIMEATGTYYLKLAITAKEFGFSVIVENPYKIKQYIEFQTGRANTDPIAAKLISKYGYENDLREFELIDEERITIKMLLTNIENLKKQKRSLNNINESFDQIPINYSKAIVKYNKKILKYLNGKIKDLKSKLEKYLTTKFSELYELATSIKGVGMYTTAVIIYYFKDFSNFENAKQAVAFSGLDPKIHQSGTSVNKRSHITKKGNKLIRKALYLASLSASTSNRKCINLKERLLKVGKKKRVIQVAIAHKLLRQLFGVIKSKKKYQSNYLKKWS